MTQEAVDNRPTVENQEPEFVTLDWNRLVTSIEKSSNLLSSQKEAVIHLLSGFVTKSPESPKVLADKIRVYSDFVDRIKSIINVDEFQLECKAKGLDARMVIDETFRRVLNVDIDTLSPAERFDVDEVVICSPTEHEIDDSPIREALLELRTELLKIEQKVESQDST